MDRPILLSGDSRVFIKENTLCCGSNYNFHSCMRMGELDKSYGDITPEYCPDPENYGRFIEIDFIEGEDSRATTSLVGRLPRKLISPVYRLAIAKCAFDLQLHFGLCENPSNFNEYDNVLILEDVSVTNYSTDPLGALTPDENSSILETIQLSVGQYYWVNKLLPKTSLGNILGELIDITQCSGVGCSACCDGCDVIHYALVFNDPDYVLYTSYDCGESWINSTITLPVVPVP